MIEQSLEEVFKKREGIALILSLIECPKCYNDIWVGTGSHDGMGGNQDMHVETDCYICWEKIKTNISNKEKNVTFSTIPEYTEFIGRKFSYNIRCLLLEKNKMRI